MSAAVRTACRAVTRRVGPPSAFGRVAIHRVRSAFPEKVYTQESVRETVLDFMQRTHPKAVAMRDWTDKVFRNSAIATKSLAYAPDEIYRYASHNSNLINDECFYKAVDLSKQVTRVLADSHLEIDEIDAVFVGSEVSNGMTIGSFTHIGKHNTNRRVKLDSMLGKGCLGGALNYRKAFDYLTAHPTHAAQTINVDLYSRKFTYNYGHVFADLGRPELENDAVTQTLLRNAFVPAVILGDAASSTVLLGEEHPYFDYSVHNEGSLVICDAESITVPDSVENVRALMKQYGQVPLLTGAIPSVGSAAIKEAYDALIARNPQCHGKIHWICAHSGGVKVLDTVEADMKLEPHQLDFSRAVLRDHGNCASPTVQLVLERMIRDLPPCTEHEFIPFASVGPGMQAIALLLERFPVITAPPRTTASIIF
jgi:predicted naringenin-chalcone synthase